MKEWDFRQPFSQAKKYSSKITCDKLLEEIRSRACFDPAICDMHVPQHLKATFSEMPSIFKNVEIASKAIRPLWLKYV